MGYYLWKVFVLDGQGGIEYLYFFSILDQTCEFWIWLFELLKLKVAFKYFFICLALLGVESFGKFLVRNYELIQLWSKVFKFVQGVLFLGFRFLRCFRNGCHIFFYYHGGLDWDLFRRCIHNRGSFSCLWSSWLLHSAWTPASLHYFKRFNFTWI